MTPRRWYRFQDAADDPTLAELFIYDDIGESWWNDNAITAKQFVEDLKALKASVTRIVLHVNSLGGSVFDAVAIANALREQSTTKGRRVETVIDGIAASAASVVIMAGSTIRIADNGLVMVHDPWSLAVGNARELRKTAETLDAIREQIIATYRWHSTKSEDELRALMADETWMSADEAIANGFATEKVEGLTAAAAVPFSPQALARFSIPDRLRERVQAHVAAAPLPRRAAAAVDVLRLCRAAECLHVAEALIEGQATLEEVQARVASEAAQRAAAKARADEITAVCQIAKLSRLAQGYINGGMSVSDVRAHVVTVTALIDKGLGEIDGSLLPDGSRRDEPVLDVLQVYRERNAALYERTYERNPTREQRPAR